MSPSRHPGAALTLHALADLKQLRQLLAEQAQQQALAQAEQVRREAQVQAEKNLFIHAIGAVQPLSYKRRVLLKKKLPAPVPTQFLLDEKAVLREALSDGFDASALLETDEHLSFRRPGVGLDITHKLRRGDWSIQRQLDLHGLRLDDARDALSRFVRESHKHGIRCVRVVHGKGLGSPGKTPVLKNRVHSWLVQKNEVLAFVQARPAHGGAGALVVLLDATHKRHRPTPGG